MKKIISLAIGLAVAMPFMASAATLTCPQGQHIENVQTNPGSPATPAVPAYDEYVFVGHNQGGYVQDEHGNGYHSVGNNHGDYNKIHHDTVPAVPATSPIFEDQCVDDVVITPPSTGGDPVVTAPRTGSSRGYRKHCVQTTSNWYCPPGAVDASQHGSIQDQINWLYSQLQALLEQVSTN